MIWETFDLSNLCVVLQSTILMEDSQHLFRLANLIKGWTQLNAIRPLLSLAGRLHPCVMRSFKLHFPWWSSVRGNIRKHQFYFKEKTIIWATGEITCFGGKCHQSSSGNFCSTVHPVILLGYSHICPISTVALDFGSASILCLTFFFCLIRSFQVVSTDLNDVCFSTRVNLIKVRGDGFYTTKDSLAWIKAPL